MTIPHLYENDMRQDRYGLKVASLLSDASDALPPDITERLRFARTQAMARRKVRQVEAEHPWLASGASVVLGGDDERPSWWNRVGAALPLLALVIGLIAVTSAVDDRTAQEMARVDAALLIDDLPPAAYADPGFSQFLKAGQAKE